MPDTLSKIKLQTIASMKFILRFLLASTFVYASVEGSAQFVPYSQFYNAALLTNPAQAAMGDHTEVTLLYRISRVANYDLPSISFIRPLYHKKGELRYGGLGATAINQRTGPSGLYNVTGAMGTFAYLINLSSKHHVSAGLQGGFINKRIDVSNITTDSQYDLGAFNPSLSTGENFQFTSVSQPVINAGFTWILTDTSNLKKASVGVAFYNMNRPTYDLIAGVEREGIMYVVTGEMQAFQNGPVSIHPSFRFISSFTHVANIGASCKYRLEKNQSIGVGAWYKTTKAIVLSLEYQSKAYTLSSSLDFTSSSGMDANINNAFEVTLGWRMNRKEKVKKKYAVPIVE
jgi:type IX secretion system PorP/SprF family membrane protein